MLSQYVFDDDGKKVISRMDGINSDMLMDITVYRMKPGDMLDFGWDDKEVAIMLMEGVVRYHWQSHDEAAERTNVFTDPPFCLHACTGVKVRIVAVKDSEIIVQSTQNDKEFQCRFYKPEDCKIELMGSEQWEGTAKREVLTIFDYQNAPYSNMVMGEVINKAGRWSSYIPHGHPQPEVYYYKFDKPQGFGASFVGENVYKITDGSATFISDGLTHPQVAAPGYNMYYCWMIRHLKDDPWTTRTNDPVHEWLLKE